MPKNPIPLKDIRNIVAQYSEYLRLNKEKANSIQIENRCIDIFFLKCSCINISISKKKKNINTTTYQNIRELAYKANFKNYLVV